MSGKRLPRVDYKSLAEFRYQIRRFSNFSEVEARRSGLEPQQHQALLAIKGHSPGVEMTVGRLAERLQVRHHTAVELTDRLESKGWIRRSRSHGDARKVNLCLTQRGGKLLEILSVSHRAELRAAGPRLIAALRSVLERQSRPSRRRRATTRRPR